MCARSATGRVSLAHWFPCTPLTLLTDAQPRRIGINETTFTPATLASLNQQYGVGLIKNVAHIMNGAPVFGKIKGVDNFNPSQAIIIPLIIMYTLGRIA